MDIQEFSKSFTNNLSRGVCNDILVNPVYVAMLITIVVLLIIVSIFENDRLCKTGFYIFLSTVIIVFLHNNLLLLEHKKRLCGNEQDNICSDIGMGSVNITKTGGSNTTDDANSLEYLTAL